MRLSEKLLSPGHPVRKCLGKINSDYGRAFLALRSSIKYLVLEGGSFSGDQKAALFCPKAQEIPR